MLGGKRALSGWKRLGSAELDRDQVVPIRTLQNHLLSASPRVSTPKLHDVQIGEDVVVEEPAKTAAVPATHFQAITDFVTGAARALDGNHLSAQRFDIFGMKGHNGSPLSRKRLRVWGFDLLSESPHGQGA
jgi:hypothetical protein